MKIDADEEPAAIAWLAARGQAPTAIGLHAWVAALDAATRKSLGQYLRLRRHRLRAPKVALEITAPVHLALSDYAARAGGLSLGDAIAKLLVPPPAPSDRTAPETAARQAALADRDKEIAALRARLLAGESVSRAKPSARASKRPPLDMPPACPICGGAMQLSRSGGARLWLCQTRVPRWCTGQTTLDPDIALSTRVMELDLGYLGEGRTGRDMAKDASAAKRTVTGFTQLVAQHAHYWSTEEAACFQVAAATLDRLVRAKERLGRKRRVEEKTQAQRVAERTGEAERVLKARLRLDSRREQILHGYALALDDGRSNSFGAALRKTMSDIDRRGLPWGAESSLGEIEAVLRDGLAEEIRHLVWRFASDQRSMAEVAAQWEAELAQRLDARRVAAEALANEVELWLVHRAIVDANAVRRAPGPTGEGA